MFGPLFGKELLEMARRRRYFLIRALIGAALLLGWWIGLSGRNWTIDYRAVGSLSAIGEKLFQWWAYLSLWGVVVLTPLLVGGLIAAEKDGRTFETLLTTLLTNREILVGKAVSRLLLLTILVASSVPILAVASLYGGFDVKQVVLATAVVLGTCFFVVVVSLYYSAMTFKPYVAMMRTYFFLAVLWWIFPAICRYSGVWELESPWRMLSSVTNDDGGAPRMVRWAGRGAPIIFQTTTISVGFFNFTSNQFWALSSAFAYAVIAAFLFWRTNRVLRKRLQPGKPPWIFSAALRLYQSMVSSARGSVKSRRHAAGWSRLWSAEEASERWWRQGLERTIDRNPLLYRNRVANAFDPERFVASIQLFVGLGAIVAFLVLGWQEKRGVSVVQQLERIGLWALVGTTILLLVCSVILAAGAFARERQYGSWEVLMLADLAPVRHLTAALVGVLGTLRLLLFIVLALTVIVGYVFSGFLPIFVWTLSVAALWLMIVAYSLFTSLFHRRIAAALPATVFGLGVLLLAPTFFAARPFVFFAPNEAVLLAFVILAAALFWFARHGYLPWFAFHFAFTLAVVGFLTLMLSNDAFVYGSSALRRVGDYTLDRRANSPPTLVAFPMGWGRRFAYGLTETIPDFKGAFTFLIAALATSLTFLFSFRALSAAEPGDVIHIREGSPNSSAQAIG